jgi:small subunit ribosomal protein S5
MNISRPARCLFCSLSRGAKVGSHLPRRQFHRSTTQLNQNPKNPNVKASDMKTLQDITRDLKSSDFKHYTEEERARLSEVYSPAQVAAIEAGEAAIDPKDLAEQFAIRRDPMKFHYLDDFSTIEPVVDKHIRAPESNSDYNAKLKSEDDFVNDFARFFSEMPENATATDWVRFADSLRLTIGKEENELNPSTALTPDLFEPGESLSQDPQPVESLRNARGKEKEPEEMTDALKRLHQTTGYTLDMIRSFKLKTLVSHAVVNQTRLGKVRRQYCLSIAGNGNGLLGIGEAKSEESGDAVTQSRYRAIRNMQPILRYENRTIFGDVKGKVGAVELKLMTRPPGMSMSFDILGFSVANAS